MGKEEDLCTAAEDGDVPAILKSLNEGANINCNNSFVSAVFVSLPPLPPFAFPFLFLCSSPPLFERLHPHPPPRTHTRDNK